MPEPMSENYNPPVKAVLDQAVAQTILNPKGELAELLKAGITEIKAALETVRRAKKHRDYIKGQRAHGKLVRRAEYELNLVESLLDKEEP